MLRVEHQPQGPGRHGRGARVAARLDMGGKVLDRAGRGAGQRQRAAQRRQGPVQRRQVEREAGVEHIVPVGAGGLEVQRLPVQPELPQHEIAAVLGRGECHLSSGADQARRLRLAAGDRHRTGHCHVRLVPRLRKGHRKLRVPIQGRVADGGQWPEVRQVDGQLPVQGRCGQDPPGDAEKRMRQHEVERPVRPVRVEGGVKREGSGCQQGRRRTRDAQAVRHRMQPHRTAQLLPGKPGGQAVHPGARGRKLVQHQAALPARRLRRAEQVRVERHLLPRHPRQRLHRRRVQRQPHVEARLQEVQGAVRAQRQHACPGRPRGAGERQGARVARAVQVQRQVQRIEQVQMRQRGHGPARRIVQDQVQPEPAGGDACGEVHGAGMVEPAQAQAEIGVRQAGDRHPAQQRSEIGDADMAVDRGGERGAGHRSLDIQASHVQRVDPYAEVQPAFLPRLRRRGRPGVGVGHRQARHVDPSDAGQLHMRGAAEQPERRPVQHEVVQGEPGAARVADLDAPHRQRVGKAAAEPLDRHQPAGQAARLLLDQPSSRPGIGADQHHHEHQRQQRHRQPDQQAQHPAGDAPRTAAADCFSGWGHQNASPRPT